MSGERTESGAWLFQIATQGGNLLTQLGGSPLISPCEGNGQGELKLLELMLPFGLELAREVTAGGWSRRASRSTASYGQPRVLGRQMGRGWIGHHTLFSHFGIRDQGL